MIQITITDINQHSFTLIISSLAILAASAFVISMICIMMGDCIGERKIVQKKPQLELLREHLFSGKEINCFQAAELYGIMRLPSRLNDLSNLGIYTRSEFIKADGKRVKSYKLKS